MNLHSPVFFCSDAFIRRIRLAALAFCWCSGLMLGLHYAYRADSTYFLLMRMAASCRVSIVGLLTAVFLPFLLSALAVYISRPELLLPVCFLKAFSFSCSAAAVSAAFGSAGWLIRFLLNFSECCTLPLLCLFWIRHISGVKRPAGRDFLICCIAVLTIGALDYLLISPYLVDLIDF